MRGESDSAPHALAEEEAGRHIQQEETVGNTHWDSSPTDRGRAESSGFPQWYGEPMFEEAGAKSAISDCGPDRSSFPRNKAG